MQGPKNILPLLCGIHIVTQYGDIWFRLPCGIWLPPGVYTWLGMMLAIISILELRSSFLIWALLLDDLYERVYIRLSYSDSSLEESRLDLQSFWLLYQTKQSYRFPLYMVYFMYTMSAYKSAWRRNALCLVEFWHEQNRLTTIFFCLVLESKVLRRYRYMVLSPYRILSNHIIRYGA